MFDNLKISFFGSPGIAMALAAAVSVYSAALTQTDKWLFLIITFCFIGAVVIIEFWSHELEIKRLETSRNSQLQK